MSPTQHFLAAAFFICHLMLSVGPVPAQDQEEGEEAKKLNALRVDFQLKWEKLNEPLRELEKGYRGYLEQQKNTYQQAGQLKAMLAVEEELETFATDPAEELSTFPELKRYQEIYREQKAARETAAMEPRKALIASYREIAEKMASTWTREGKIEVAKEALAEAERFVEMQKEAAAETPASQMNPLDGVAVSDFEGQEAGEEKRNSLGMKLCWIPPGSFTMGTPENEEGHNADREKQVDVRITQGFWIGKYEVTQGEYEGLMGSNPSSFAKLGEKAPVDKVTWLQAEAFCKALTEREKDKLPEGWAYQLPTEAQWEYAARAGEEGPFSGGTMEEVGWITTNSEGSPQEVGKKKPNAWGLHDVHGNLREWCHDWMAEQMDGGRDPEGPASGNTRTIRGGCWNYPPRPARVGHRMGINPAETIYDIGFRISLGPAR